MRKFYSLFIIVFSILNVEAQGIYQLWGTTQISGDENLGTLFNSNATGDNYLVKKQFSIKNPGASPQLTEFSEFNGKLYGVTTSGGNTSSGVIFEWNPADNKYVKRFGFNDIDGSGPTGRLTLFNGKFYGLTQYGGEGAGVIYEWDPSTGIYIKKFSFTIVDNNGYWPIGSLVLKGGKFYGMASRGGISDKGVIFEWDPATNVYIKKIDFNGTNGKEPYGNLLLDGVKFYGMTPGGGVNNLGVLFEWDPATNVFIKKIDFNGTNGSTPYGCLAAYNGKMYGVTQRGNVNDEGIIFEWNPATNVLTKKYDFNTANGYWPSGNLELNAGKFYSMTARGGSNDAGSIFEWNPSTNIYTKKIDLSAANGSYPNGQLHFTAGKFYGMTPLGGTFNQGVIFEWDAANNAYQKKIDFNDYADGTNPTGNLSVLNGKWYGLTNKGGANNAGVIFEYDPASGQYSKKIDLHDTNGSRPNASLLLHANKFYGMTPFGGANDEGVIFEWDPSTNTYTKKIDFDYSTTGGRPYGSLAFNNSKFYGMTYQGGDFGLGTIFQWDAVTNVYSKKYNFNSNGYAPTGSLTLLNGKFYGMTLKGGANFAGVIFEWDPSTNIFTVRYDFNTANGKSPAGSLSLNNGKFYGLTTAGGSNNLGVIFEWDPATNIYTKKKDFANSADGNRSYGDLVLSSGKFYGLTKFGGNNFGGVLFEWDPSTNIYTKKQDMSGTSSGSFPGVVNNLSKLPAPVAKGLANSCTGFSPVIINSSNNNSWVPIMDDQGNAVAEIKANGNNLGLVTVSMYINNGTVREDGSRRLYLDRNLSITAAVQPSSAVDIRLYLKNSEYNAMKNASNSTGQPSNINSITDIGVYRNADSCSAVLVRNAIPVASTALPWEADHVFLVTVSSLGSFYFYSLTQGGPLPSTNIIFNGRLMKENAELNWKTTDEYKTESFDLERSTNGTDYTNINTTAAVNQSGIHQYQYIDKGISSLGSKQIYYRLKQKDIDGKYNYTQIVVFSLLQNNAVLLYPNPVNDNASIAINSATSEVISIKLVDNLGRTLKADTWKLIPGRNTTTINVSALASGVYFLELKGNTINEKKRFIKQ